MWGEAEAPIEYGVVPEYVLSVLVIILVHRACGIVN
jgi:hypothetical protein